MDQLLSLKIVKIIQETEHAKTFVFLEESEKISFEAGQFLTFSLMIDGEEVRRSFSISSAPYELPYISITLKRSLTGFASNFLFENLRVGDTLNAYPPMGEFTVNAARTAKDLYLIGAGSGITPLFSIIKQSLHINENRKLHLIYGNTNLDSVIFRDGLVKLAKQYPDKFELISVLSQPDADYQGIKGRITKTFVTEYFKDRNISQAHFFLCGPPQMMIEAISYLKNMNIYSDQIHQEYFKVIITQNADEDDEEIKERQVTILFEGKEHKILVRQNDSILESALENGLEIPNSCRVGQCTSCRARLISGKLNLVDQTALSDDDIKMGYCLTCVGFPLSDDIVIDYDVTEKEASTEFGSLKSEEQK